MDDRVIQQRRDMPIHPSFKKLSMIRCDNEITVIQSTCRLQVIVELSKFFIYIGNIFIVLAAGLVQFLIRCLRRQKMSWFRNRAPIIIEHSDETAVWKIGFVGRPKMEVAYKGTLQTGNFLCDPIKNLLEYKVKLIFHEIWNPARILFLQIRKSKLLYQVTLELI